MIKPMLAHKVNENRIDFSEKVFIQPKLDGVRCIFTKDGRKIICACCRVFMGCCGHLMRSSLIVWKWEASSTQSAAVCSTALCPSATTASEPERALGQGQ